MAVEVNYAPIARGAMKCIVGLDELAGRADALSINLLQQCEQVRLLRVYSFDIARLRL